MANPKIEQLTARIDNDLPRSALLKGAAPALAAAFDGDGMKQTLQETLIDSNDSRYSIMQCVPGKALYLPEHVINMQYKLTLADTLTGQVSTFLVNGRLFQNLAECKTYVDEKLMPIAAGMTNREEIGPFDRPVALIEPLCMALSAFPIDGLIPTLVHAADPNRIASIVAEALPETLSGEFRIQDVRLVLAHYGRYKRCVLRYAIQGTQTRTGSPEVLTVYGKVDADGLGAATLSIISALRKRLDEPQIPYRFRIPRSLGYFPDLQLLMMEALPGKPFFKDLLKTWGGSSVEGGNGSAAEDNLTLEAAVQTCARIAATVHGSDIDLGRRNTLELQVAKLQQETDFLGQVFPELGLQIRSWIDETVEFARDYPEMPLCFSHGDFTYTQLIFDGKDGGLVDFDSFCQAEPAQDLGHYLAYQRLNIIKDQDLHHPFAPEAIESLCSLFLDTYIEARKGWVRDERIFRGRVAVYELISLIRLALHSWEKMKGSRLKQTLALLEERMEWQKQVSLSAKNKMQ